MPPLSSKVTKLLDSSDSEDDTEDDAEVVVQQTQLSPLSKKSSALHVSPSGSAGGGQSNDGHSPGSSKKIGITIKKSPARTFETSLLGLDDDIVNIDDDSDGSDVQLKIATPATSEEEEEEEEESEGSSSSGSASSSDSEIQFKNSPTKSEKKTTYSAKKKKKKKRKIRDNEDKVPEKKAKVALTVFNPAVVPAVAPTTTPAPKSASPPKPLPTAVKKSPSANTKLSVTAGAAATAATDSDSEYETEEVYELQEWYPPDFYRAPENDENKVASNKTIFLTDVTVDDVTITLLESNSQEKLFKTI